MKVRIAKRKRPRDKMPRTQGWIMEDLIAAPIASIKTEYSAIAIRNKEKSENISNTKEERFLL
jgi:hypothetical protein